VPSLLAPTKTVMLAAETREGAKATMAANAEAAENFMISKLEQMKRLRRLVKSMEPKLTKVRVRLKAFVLLAKGGKPELKPF